MSKLSLILFGSPLADVATRAVRRITVGAVGAVLAVLLLVVVNNTVPIPKDWGWAPVAVVLIFSLWCLWHLAVGMHLAAQWLGLIAERPVRFGTANRGVAAAGSESSEQAAADAIALSDDDGPASRGITAAEGPSRAGKQKWQQREEAAQASGAPTRPKPPPHPATDPADTRTMSPGELPSPPRQLRPPVPPAQRPERTDEPDPPPLNRRIVRELNTKSDDETVDEDA